MRLQLVARLVLPFAFPTRCGAQSGDQAIMYSKEPDSSCHNACLAIKSILSLQTYHTAAPDSVSSPDLKSSFFAIQQQEVLPACWFTPTSAHDVSVALNIIREHSCPFAVKSGGHAPNAEASSAEGGVTIDMRLFDGVEFLGDDGEGEATRVGTGGRWGEVYKKLEPIGKTVVGGRDQRVGVGGLLLGGGISFISRRYGWAIDNVRNYEVILANGTIAQINQHSAPDLYWALRGGGNNFGIVTHFDLATYPLTQAWGGYNFYLLSDASSRLSTLKLPPTPFAFSLPSIIQKLGHAVNFAACKIGYCITIDQWIDAFLGTLKKEQKDIDAQLIVSLAYVSEVDLYLAFHMPMYAKPVPNPPVFDSFKKLPHVFSSNRVSNFSSFHHELVTWNVGGFRQVWGALTIKPNKELIQQLVDIFMTASESIKHFKSIQPSNTMQAINEDEILHMSKNGGNPLGLRPNDGPLIIFSFTIRYANPSDDHAVNAAGARIISESTALAKKMNLHHPYIYQNYANVSQDVFASYGPENHAKLRDIQNKWDPEGVFGRRGQPGYFKV